MVAVLVAAITFGFCIAVADAVRRDRLVNFPPSPVRPVAGERIGFGDK